MVFLFFDIQSLEEWKKLQDRTSEALMQLKVRPGTGALQRFFPEAADCQDRTQEDVMIDFVIAGAGICGLELGAMLAHDGKRVVVLEKQKRIGGRAFLWKKEGFVVDNGVHLIRFGPKSATAEVFRHLGKELEFTDLGPSYVLDLDGRVKDFPTSPQGLLTTKLMTLRERLKALGVLIQVKRGDPEDLLETSVAQWMDRMGLEGGVRRYLTLVTASMQVCPFTERASAGEMLLNFQSVLKKGKSVMYPTRGWAWIYDELTSAIRENGEIRTGARVTSVEIRDGRAVGVRVGDELIEAENVIVNLPSQEIFSLLDESRTEKYFAARCRNQRPTAGVVLDYGLDRRIRNDSGLWYIYDPMSFGMFTSNLCPETAPPGKQLLTWFYPTNLEDMKSPKKAKARVEEMEAALFRLFPGLHNAVQWRRVQKLRMVDGTEVNVDQHRRKRPGYTVPGVGGLYLVGDSLRGPGAGGDVGHESVLECYRKITGREA
jgi:phytoene dehydrogenase-like protein